ncbi:MAG: class I SAM-dependent methyltransferase [Chloroflexaceae bacterium]|nr:class I SAM-dependent methyltransferase [Chloroflexaceae bacterium]
MLLRPEQREKLDSSPDVEFYAFPRFVNHVDDGFIEQLTALYRKRLQPQTRVFDMMSSWVSHLPPEMTFAHVEGQGMNAEELAKNPRFDHYFTQNLNENPRLPLSDGGFDAVLNAVSVQYLQYPEAIFSEIYRILKPGGLAVISFSNRMFYQKAIAAWRDSSEARRVELVKHYFRSVSGFSEPETQICQSAVPPILQLFGFGGGDPFYAVMARKL